MDFETMQYIQILNLKIELLEMAINSNLKQLNLKEIPNINDSINKSEQTAIMRDAVNELCK